MPLRRNKLGIGGKASLRRTRTIRDLRKYFLHKGKSMEESHGEISSKIARRRDLAHQHVMKNVVLSVKDLQAKRILDVGTGYGMSLSFLARRFGKRSRIWSVDASTGVVREARKSMIEHGYSRHVVVKRGNAEQLPFRSHHFDLVISVFVLHHLSNPKRGLFEMGRVLSRGGKLIIADWSPSAGKALMLHAQSDFPSPIFVIKQLKGLGYSTRSRIRRYWYLIEAVSEERRT